MRRRTRVSLDVDGDPAETDVRDLAARLRAFNEARTGRPLNLRRFAVWLRDGGGTIVGGLVGSTNWDSLFVDELFVDEALRSRGWGRRLLETAERVARERGCRRAWLDTMSFQAPGFYERMGYAVFGVMEDHPRGHRRFWFWKPLPVGRLRPRRPAPGKQRKRR